MLDVNALRRAIKANFHGLPTTPKYETVRPELVEGHFYQGGGSTQRPSSGQAKLTTNGSVSRLSTMPGNKS
jgi:hypothetical protein